jgi:type I restriction enzyme S subunit
MAGERQYLEFREICEHSAFGPRFSSDEYAADGNVACLRTMDIDSDGRIDFNSMPLARLDLHRLRNHILRRDDLVITRTGAYLGKAAIFSEFRLPVLPGAFSIRFRLKRDVADPLFVRYYFNSSEGQEAIRSIATGSAQPNLNIPNLYSLKLPIPSLAEQIIISSMLKALDDKIEVNLRMNATLDATARALFRSWFIEFDPVRAKLDGRKPPGLDKATTPLFPNHFQDSPIGPIPKGWTVEDVGEVVDCVGGSTPSTTEPNYWEGGTHHWTTPKDFSSLQAPFLLETDRKITNSGLARISSGLLPAGTLLLSSRAPVGYLAIATMPVAINQGFIAIKCNERATNYFMLNWCRSNMIEIESRATGTTFAEISKSNFRPIQVLLPPKEVMSEFTERTSPLYARIIANLHQSRTLATLRDTLLPKLLSGELSSIDRGMEEVK